MICFEATDPRRRGQSNFSRSVTVTNSGSSTGRVHGATTECVNGTLFVVATPIGALSDVSLRAREVLAAVDRIAAEDTRVTRTLLRELRITPPPLISYHDHNENDRVDDLIGRLQSGEDVALVSDAGTPLISDPGYRLVTAAVASGIPVVVVPGPCSAIAALSGSGLPVDRFLFLGFLPREPGRRDATLAERAWETATLVFFESPHRLRESLSAISAAWGPRRLALVHNLTKPTERWRRGTLASVAAELAAEEEIRGEITLVVSGYEGPSGVADDQRVEALIVGLVEAGVPVGTVRDVVARVYDRPRRDVYQSALAARRTRREEP
jgi:16S rRNA (cytidine1402-2'-O)-methyltransferase